MTLKVYKHDGAPTDHPNVSEDRAPSADSDDAHYCLSVKGDDTSVSFFVAFLRQNLDESLYHMDERGAHGNYSVFGIHEDDIEEVVDVFEQTVDSISDVRIVGNVDGEEYQIDRWDGERSEVPEYMAEIQ